MDKQSRQLLVTIFLPVLCLFFSGGLFLFEKTRLYSLTAELSSTESQIKSLENLLKDMEGEKQTSRYPTVDQSREEQPLFLNNLRAAADANHVELVRWTNAPPQVLSASAAAAKKASSDAMPLTSTVEAQGNYAALRRFLYSLLRTPRLLTLNDMKWSRGSKGAQTEVTFSLTRYVAPPGKGSAAVRAAADREKGATTSTAPPLEIKPGLLYRPGVAIADGGHNILSSAANPTKP